MVANDFVGLLNCFCTFALIIIPIISLLKDYRTKKNCNFNIYSYSVQYFLSFFGSCWVYSISSLQELCDFLLCWRLSSSAVLYDAFFPHAYRIRQRYTQNPPMANAATAPKPTAIQLTFVPKKCCGIFDGEFWRILQKKKKHSRFSRFFNTNLKQSKLFNTFL